MIIANHHQRGADELPRRGFKDFGVEALPFKRFAPHRAFYYIMLIAFFLFEIFKIDVLSDASYATTVRRLVVDFAAKIIKTGRKIIFKVNQTIMDRLKLFIIWQRCKSLPLFQY